MRGQRKGLVIQGRKNCRCCGSWRYLHEFPIRRKIRDGYVVALVDSNCFPCKRAKQRKKYANDPEYRQRTIDRVKAYDAANPKRIAARKRRYESKRSKSERRRQRHRWRMKNDPEYAARRRERARIYAEAKRRERGMKIAEGMIAQRTSERGVRLDIAPMQVWVLEKLSNGYAGDVSRLATRSNVDEGVIRKVRDGTYELNDRMADHILTHEGSTLLLEVYPELYSD